MKPIVLNERMIKKYYHYLQQEEKSKNTIEKYIRDIQAFLLYLGEDTTLTKEKIIAYKQCIGLNHKLTSVNSMLISIHGLLDFMNMGKYKVKLHKIQKRTYSDESENLSKEEYYRLIDTAKQNGNQKLSLLIETICAAGIRVSEHKFITVEALRTGKVFILNKGKSREIFLPKKLRYKLSQYCKEHKLTSGPVFVTKTGRALDRSNIWSMMKRLCKNAKVEEKKVYPHNLRHLFAYTYYKIEKDVIRLADILGHSSVDTTRIYTKISSKEIYRSLHKINDILLL